VLSMHMCTFRCLAVPCPNEAPPETALRRDCGGAELDTQVLARNIEMVHMRSARDGACHSPSLSSFFATGLATTIFVLGWVVYCVHK
jgi:hypothetical protein